MNHQFKTKLQTILKQDKRFYKDRKPHKKEKLLVYKEYLKAYLSILNNTKFYSRIFIWDIFAGDGTGSPSIAINVIKNLNNINKSIRLHLNDLNHDRYKELLKLVKSENAEEFTEVFNEPADSFIDKVTSVLKNQQYIHNLFFIDPYGYTQYSQENLNNLFSLKKSEYFIFIPITHIYRFKDAAKNPARKFLLDLGMKEENLNDQSNLHDLYNDLTSTLGCKAATQYVYYYELKNTSAPNSIHLLLFITKNIIGAEKFLENVERIKVESEKQGLLFDLKEELKEFLSRLLQNSVTNHKIHEEGIKAGFLPKKINPLLKEWEKADKLEISEMPEKRKKGAFYLRDRKKTITIRLCQR